LTQSDNEIHKAARILFLFEFMILILAHFHQNLSTFLSQFSRQSAKMKQLQKSGVKDENSDLSR